MTNIHITFFHADHHHVFPGGETLGQRYAAAISECAESQLEPFAIDWVTIGNGAAVYRDWATNHKPVYLEPGTLRVWASFSAGYGAVRKWLEGVTAPDAVCLIDSCHAGFDPPGTVAGAVRAEDVAAFRSYAKAAAAGAFPFYVGYTDVPTVGYASTEQTAKAIVDGILEMASVLPAGGKQETWRKGGLVVRDHNYAGPAAGTPTWTDAALEHSRALTTWGPGFLGECVAHLLRLRQGGQGPPVVVVPPLPGSGLPEPALWRPLLKLGMRDLPALRDISAWQLELGQSSPLDGIFGPHTHEMTVSWQAARGLKADGLVGPATRTAIGAPPLPLPDPSGRRVPAVKTPATAAEVARALVDVDPKLRAPELSVLLAQWALETGHGVSMYNWNFGNVKAGPWWGGDRAYFPMVSELIDGQWHTFVPPDPQTDFRSFPTIENGALAWYSVLTAGRYAPAFVAARIVENGALAWYSVLTAGRYAPAFVAARIGDAMLYAKELRRLGPYFTATLTNAQGTGYGDSLVKLTKQLRPVADNAVIPF